jgi:hypothetical protein
MNYEIALEHFPMYGIIQGMNGEIITNNTRDFIEDALQKEKSAPMNEEFISNNIQVNQALKAIENQHQGPMGLNVKLQKLQPQSIGGRMFKPKNKYRSKYL